MKILLATVFTLVSLLADDLSFSNDNEAVANKHTPVYTIQLFTTKDLKYANELVENMNSQFQNKTHVYKSGEYYVARFAQDRSYKYLKPFVFTMQNMGYKTAYISELTLEQMQRELIKDNKTIKKEPIEISQNTITVPKISKSNITLKANDAYKRGDEYEAIMYYEMLSASGYSNNKIKNNLCYLYGKRGAWLNAKELIDKEHYQSKFLYAYAYGAVQSLQKDYYSNLLPYISVDNSGLLMLLTATYFERKNDMQRASSFYKLAYEKNPTNPYIIYSYARSADIQNDKQKAKKLYNKVFEKVDFENQIYKITKQRLVQIGN
ncbi:tetratricopeptide repeat protein [Candidatus Sulfurimonas baltica]|uniref:SPOR domain-containing protein n=1 Tax=Candidatus Sulfurimonas baltica TaxID=2740404 RepID=A0A7S7LYT5_9BACT|nr:hypothetical protein [Candidatus Sulfurimonas baltica]QOY53059.1 hypothetical protein HUE88_05105 [Candidatus Sulfurimonas baltica]